MKTIKIAGAGISGLTAAINLKKAGFQVEIYEKNKQSGMRYHEDFQGIENWTTNTDALENIKNMGLKTDFFYKPFSEMYLASPKGKKYHVESKIPNYYLVKRGISNDSLDQGILNQAKELGIKIHFNTKLDEKDADILATGSKGVKAMGQEIIFDTNQEDTAITIMNNHIAPSGYAYLFVINKKGLIMNWYFKDFDKGKNLLEKTIDYFDNILKIDKNNIKKIGGFVDFKILKNYEQNGKILIGEAAGIQDYIASFGIILSIKSGYLAAKSIIENKSYDKLVKKEIVPQLETSIVGRYLWEKMNNKGYETFIKKASGMKNTNELLKKMYKNNFLKKIILPFAKLKYKTVYEK